MKQSSANSNFNANDIRSRSYGNVPAQTSSLIIPEMRPNFAMFANQSTETAQSKSHPHYHQSIPKPAESKTYESFEMSQNVKQPNYFAEQDHADRHKRDQINGQSSQNCPNCLGGIANFKLTNDPTDSVFCAVCRQPFHFCRVHNIALQGMGRNQRDPQLNQCQCERSQTFLNDNSWNSCFNK